MLFPLETLTRELKSLDGLWDLYFDKNKEGQKKKFFVNPPTDTIEIAVPASINEQIVDRQSYLYMDWVWYFKEFIVPMSWKKEKRVFIRLGSATFRADVYLNGKLLGSHEGGYSPFEFEITKLAKFGEKNLLSIRIDNILDATTIPQGNLPSIGGVTSWRTDNYPNVHYDFFPFTGIHRPVVLYATNSSKIENIKVTTLSLSQSKVKADLKMTFSGEADKLEVSIDELKFQKVISVAKGSSEITSKFELSDVTPWSSENPKLYDIDFKLIKNGEVSDVYTLPFGFRTIKVKGGKLLINDKQIFLRGFGKHEDLNVIGKGMNYPYMVKDRELMDWIGANSFRTSHYPYSEEIMHMADRHGWYIIDEVAANTLSMMSVRDPKLKAKLSANHKQQTKELIDRDYNHPCVITWSLGNECETMIAEGKGYFKDLVAYAKTIDQSRPVTFVLNSGYKDELEADVFDIIAINRYPSWYGHCGKYEDIEKILAPTIEGFWKRFKKPILIAEFGADAVTGLHSEYNLMWSEEYQVEMLKRVIDLSEKYPYVCGTHVWNFADFKVGQHTGRIILNWKGVFTRDRHPKLAAHELRKRWKTDKKK